jgi:hypothetical protein
MKEYDLKVEKIFFNILNKLFENLELRSGKLGGNYENWYGFFDKNDNLFLGYSGEEKNRWYYDGREFTGYLKIFDISNSRFVSILKTFIDKKYGIKIKTLI